MKINEGSEKMPWQWQYDRDDDALLDKYYRVLDDLYIFLEENTVPEWQESPLRKKLAACFVKNLDTFQEVFPLEDSHRMFYILVPFMLEVQDRIIRPIVGDEEFEKMKTAPMPEELAEQLAAAKRCVPLYAVITAVKRMSIKVLPTMIGPPFLGLIPRQPRREYGRRSNPGAAAIRRVRGYRRQKRTPKSRNETPPTGT